MSLGEERPATPRGWPDSYDGDARPRMGFFTDTTLCIGCKACEVACKEWNQLPTDDLGFKGHSYDNTGELSADTWRHVAFVEQARPAPDGDGGMRWLMSSDVCKHCTTAPCLDVCPTGALFRTEFGTVLCYDRLKDGLEPAFAKACPTDSIMFGPLDDLRDVAAGRLRDVKLAGEPDARLYLHGDDDGVDGGGAFFLLLDEPEVYGLPPDPVAPTHHLGTIWGAVAGAAATIAAGVAVATLGGARWGKR